MPSVTYVLREYDLGLVAIYCRKGQDIRTATLKELCKGTKGVVLSTRGHVLATIAQCSCGCYVYCSKKQFKSIAPMNAGLTTQQLAEKTNPAAFQEREERLVMQTRLKEGCSTPDDHATLMVDAVTDMSYESILDAFYMRLDVLAIVAISIMSVLMVGAMAFREGAFTTHRPGDAQVTVAFGIAAAAMAVAIPLALTAPRRLFIKRIEPTLAKTAAVLGADEEAIRRAKYKLVSAGARVAWYLRPGRIAALARRISAKG